jgi:glycoprotein endo-alpha-1,2-mannosidase
MLPTNSNNKRSLYILPRRLKFVLLLIFVGSISLIWAIVVVKFAIQHFIMADNNNNNVIQPLTTTTTTTAISSSPLLRKTIETTQPQITQQLPKPTQTSSKTHIFYYSWYGNPTHDQSWIHWNHEILPHWEKFVNTKFPQIGTFHTPPQDIGANFYPELGPYSSSDPIIIKRHCEQMSQAGIGVIVHSWYPPGEADGSGKAELADGLTKILIQAAYDHGMMLAFHIEPYKKRTATTIKRDLKYLSETYGSLNGIAKTNDGRMIIYLYDSYLVPMDDWASVFQKSGSNSVRGLSYDAYIYALVVEERHLNENIQAGFDGLYTYFASDGFVYSSTKRNWPHIGDFARLHGMGLSLSVGPGYEDSAIRPWNTIHSRTREGGNTYKQAWNQAILANPTVISITSWNEWHEGTQIEPAIPKSNYLDYLPLSSTGYLDITREMVGRFDVGMGKE